MAVEVAPAPNVTPPTPPLDALNNIGRSLSAQRLKTATVVNEKEPVTGPVATSSATPIPVAAPETQAPSPTAADDDKKKLESIPVQTESKVVVEPPAVAPETKPEKTEPKKFEQSQVADYLKELDEPEVKPKEEKPQAAPLPKEVEDELKAYRSLKSNPLYAAVEEIVKNGGDIRAFAKKFEVPDYDKMLSSDIYKNELKKQALSDEEINEAMEEFNELPTHKQKLLTNPIRAQLKKDADEQTKNLLPAPDPAEQRRIAELQSKSANEAVGNLDRLIQKAADKGYYGYVLDKEDQQAIRTSVMNNTQVGPDGVSYDVATSFHQQMRMNEKIFKKMLRNATEMGEYIGYEKFIKDRVRVDKNEFVANSGGGDGKVSITDVIRQRGIVTPIQNGK